FDHRSGSRCRYAHTATSVSPEDAGRAQAGTIPALSNEELSRLGVGGIDLLYGVDGSWLSPPQTNSALRRFLYDDYRFSNTSYIYAFVNCLSNVNSQNTLWSAEDRQLFILDFAKVPGNGMLRVGDIIRWAQVSTQSSFASRQLVLSFQRGYLPLLRSTLHTSVNALYGVLLDNFDAFSATVEGCMDDMIATRSFKDRQSSMQTKAPQGHQIFATLTTILFECLSRFKAAPVEHPALLTLVHKFDLWMETWSTGVMAVPPTFDDGFADHNVAIRTHIISHIRGKLARLVLVAKREQGKLDASQRQAAAPADRTWAAYRDEGLSAALHTAWVPPGGRHDNDHEDIGQIRVAPTHDELLSIEAPCLPANIYGAPHHLPVETMDRHLDINFRLLREELTAPIRSSVRHVRADLLRPGEHSQLSVILDNRGGKYRGANDEMDSVLFNVYTGVRFETLTPDRRGLSVKLTIDTPPGPARNVRAGQRAAYWQSNSGKRLMQGSLVALAWKDGGEVAVHLGLISSSTKEVSDSAQRHPDKLSIKISFFDSDLQFRILNVLKLGDNSRGGVKLLVEAPVMYEAIRPFLEALKTVEPATIPFATYLPHHPAGHFDNVAVPPPNYARAPGFRFNLSSLFEEGDGDGVELDATDKASIALCRRALRYSRLDPSQADAVVDTLTREVALLQGPPGTGKSFTGVELLRVLLAAKTKPILLIAFTNHALDHLLGSTLDAGFTKKIIRLGSRSADERISQYSIETLELVAGRSRLDRVSNTYFRDLKDVEKEIESLMQSFLSTEVSSEEKRQHLGLMFPEHAEFLAAPPAWIATIRKQLAADEEEGYTRVRKSGPVRALDNSMYAYWSEGRDLDYIRDYNEPPEMPVMPRLQERARDPNANMFSILAKHGDHGMTMADDEVDEEDEHSANKSSASIASDDSDDDDDDDDDDNDITDLFRNDWAASVSVDQEPANRPWDASSVGSVIADPATPRALSPQPPPDANTTVTAVAGEPQGDEDDSAAAPPDIPTTERTTEALLDDADMWSMSLSERRRLDEFWTAEIRESRIDDHLDNFTRLQRRHADILRRYQEGKDEVCDHRMYWAAKLTSLLHGLGPRVMVVEEAGQVLETHVIGTLVPSVEHLILIGDPLQLRPTLNNFALSMDNKRGRELYRFDMSLMERLANAGFPLSQINVQRRMRPQISNLVRHRLYPALVDNDRVKDYDDVHGMAKNVSMIKDFVLYLLRQGCYSQDGDIVVLCMYLGQLVKLRDALSREVVVVIDDRDARDIAAHEDVDEDDIAEAGATSKEVQVSKQVRLRTVDNFQGEEAKANQIVILSTVRNAGSVDEITGTRRSTKIGFLKEGLYILGNAPQLALRSPMWADVIQQLEQDGCVGQGLPIVCHRHPHNVTQVSEPGQLRQLAPDGERDDWFKPQTPHISLSYQMSDLESVSCDVEVEKDLPSCEHSASMPCSWDEAQYRCMRSCDGVMACCGRTICPHKTCPVPCGSACIRLPCDEPCRKPLQCGHPCPSVCGEDCSKQLCLECASAEDKKDVADMILYRTLDDLDPSVGTLDELIITNPKCGHTFTVETLDGTLNLNFFYEQDEQSGTWTALKATSNEKPLLPVCPTCRSLVTAPRYSRATKSAQLDVQEKKVISKMNHQLSRIHNGIERVSIEAMKERFNMLVGRITVGGKQKNVKARKAAAKARNGILKQHREVPTALEAIHPTNKTLFNISPPSALAWKREAQPLFAVYREAHQVASTRSAHTSAWEASFAYLYKAEMDLATADPARAPRRPNEYAMRMARMKVGQTEPLADRRFVVEAIWATLQLRFHLSSLALAWLQECCKAGQRIPAEERGEWDAYIRFLLASAEADARIAHGIARKTGSRKQMTRAMVLGLRAGLEVFRANIELSRLCGAPVSQDERRKRADRAHQEGRAAQKLARDTVREHAQALPQDRGEWLRTNFETAAALIVDEWEKLEQSLRADSFYEPLSLDEQTAIVRAFNFSHTGHWYNCPNGHTFVIDDCGGANQVATCPECGANIGGSNHALEGGNSSNPQYEALLRQQGAQNSPWPWAQGV
ncbi:hypothetical protein HDZ31DRAFT_43128, partial [Schizophyllum fasciatum]